MATGDQRCLPAGTHDTDCPEWAAAWRCALARRAAARGVEIRGFYHTSTWRPHWREVIEEQLLLLDGRRPVTEDFANRTSGAVPWDLTRRYASLLEASSGGLYLNVGGGTEADAAAVREAVEALLLTRRDRVRVAFHRTVPRGEYGRASARRRLELDRAQAPTWRWVEAQMAGGLALRTSPCDKCGCYDIYPPLSNDLTAQREIRFRLVV
eukprot:EG_transcript_8856